MLGDPAATCAALAETVDARQPQGEMGGASPPVSGAPQGAPAAPVSGEPQRAASPPAAGDPQRAASPPAAGGPLRAASPQTAGDPQRAASPPAAGEPLRVVAPPPEPPGPGEPLRAGHVLHALAERLPRDAILVEETPSSRPELHARIPARAPQGFLSAMGMLGFALPAAIGLRMARPDRPVLAVVGDGSSLYQIQALWSAAAYEVGVLFIVLRNGGYAIMNRLAERTGSDGPWPAIEGVDIAAMARAQGVAARTIDDLATLLATLDAELGPRKAPLLLEIVVEQRSDLRRLARLLTPH